MARMLRPSLEEEGEPEVLACVVAEQHALCVGFNAHLRDTGDKQRIDGVPQGKSGKLAAQRPESDSFSSFANDKLYTSAKETFSPVVEEEPVAGETSALLPARLLRSRSKKAAFSGGGSIQGAYGGTVALVGDEDLSSTKTPIANRVLSCLIAMLQGVEVLCSLAILYLYKDDFRLDPAILAVAMGALKVPWTIKPLWALMSDNLPLFGYRRKSYMFIGSSLCIFALLGMGIFGYRDLWTTTLLLFLYFVGSAMCNVIGEALVVEAGRKASNGEGAADSVSVFFAFRKISFAVMSYLSGFLLNYMDKRFVFILGTTLPLAVFVTNFFLTETRAIVLPLREQLQRLLEIMRRPIVLNSTLFIFLMMSTPSAGSIMFYYMTNELKFGPELLGRMALFQSIASLLGIVTYWWLFRKTNLRKLLLFSTLLVTPFCLLPVVLVQRWNVQLGIPDTAFVVTDTVLMEFVGELQTMPVLVLGARLCPPGLESSIYSFLLSAYNLGLGFGSLLSAGMTAAYGISATNFEHMTSMIIVCALTNLLPLGVLSLVPDSLSSSSSSPPSPRAATSPIGSSFSSDTESGSSQISTCSASEVEKGAATTSNERGSRRHSLSESSDSDVGMYSSSSRNYHASRAAAAAVARDPQDTMKESEATATTRPRAYRPEYASRATLSSPASAAHAAGGRYAQAPAAAGFGTEGGAEASTAGVGVYAVPAASAASHTRNERDGEEAAAASACAPAAADVVAAAMECGGSGECTSILPLANSYNRSC